MNVRRQLTVSALVLGLGLGLGLGGGSTWAQTATHDHGGTQLELTLNAGAKWRGDENMIKGMNGIHSAIAAKVPAIDAGTLPAEDYKALATEIQGQVDFMVQNCKLEPEVDEQFHLVLAQVLDGITGLQGEADPHAGVLLIVQALEAYGTHFEHPNWQSL
ncbi:MAG TPA: hypothetical protein VLZ56_03440 [Mycoplana sp.]|nr:hypothetical protein [Mycoplana sp.]